MKNDGRDDGEIQYSTFYFSAVVVTVADPSVFFEIVALTERVLPTENNIMFVLPITFTRIAVFLRAYGDTRKYRKISIST